jgi:hypothetical protein
MFDGTAAESGEAPLVLHQIQSHKSVKTYCVEGQSQQDCGTTEVIEKCKEPRWYLRISLYR